MSKQKYQENSALKARFPLIGKNQPATISGILRKNAKSYSAIETADLNFSKTQEKFLFRKEFPMAVNVLLLKMFNEASFKQNFYLLINDAVKNNTSFLQESKYENYTFNEYFALANKTIFALYQNSTLTLTEKDESLDLISGFISTLSELNRSYCQLEVFSEIEKRTNEKLVKGVQLLAKTNQEKKQFNSTIYYVIEKAIALSESYEDIEKQYMQNFLNILQNTEQLRYFEKTFDTPIKILKALLTWELKEQQLQIFKSLDKSVNKGLEQLNQLKNVKFFRQLKSFKWFSELLTISNALLVKRFNSESRYFSQILSQLESYHFLQLNFIDFKQLDIVFHELSLTNTPYSRNWQSVKDLYLQQIINGKRSPSKPTLLKREKNTLKLFVNEIFSNCLKEEKALKEQPSTISMGIFNPLFLKEDFEKQKATTLKQNIEKRLDSLFCV